MLSVARSAEVLQSVTVPRKQPSRADPDPVQVFNSIMSK